MTVTQDIDFDDAYQEILGGLKPKKLDQYGVSHNKADDKPMPKNPDPFAKRLQEAAKKYDSK